ncbi:MAG TPA: hypothetical protein VLE53_19880 [Gemmatimonadaceae bacterium]|nr:hypothetical protein [Gemmatimonadaceae bacterium]
MQFNEFCACLCVLAPLGAGAQSIPGRDLLEFPLGSLAEGGALSLSSGDGFRNPAAAALPPGARARFTVSSLTTGSDQGVAGQIVALTQRGPRATALGITVARAVVTDIVRTETDPQAVGGAVPYGTLVVSAHAARRTAGPATAGVAVRYQRGELDLERRGGVGIDAGVVAENLLGIDGRLAAATFLWRPGTRSREGAAFTGAFDARALGADTLRELRAAYSYSHAPGRSREHFVWLMGRLGPVEGRVGAARTFAASHRTTRARLAIGLHHARYLVAVAREESPFGLSPVYHFTLVTTFARD